MAGSDPPLPASQPGLPHSHATSGAHLAARAVTYLRERGGTATDEELVAFVFGTTGSIRLWQPLLATLLETDTRLRRQPDGLWSLNGPNPASGPGTLDTFIAIDVETTGLQARTQRVIEIALIRFEGGQEIERIDTLVNPERRIPAYIAKLTGIDDDQVAGAPSFADVAGQVESFLDGALLLGHNVGFDIGFLSAELQRAGKPALINERLDSMSLGVRMLPKLRRPSLDRIAAELGLPPRKIHRAGTDASLTAQVVFRLLEIAKPMGVTTIDHLKSLGAPRQRQPVERAGRARAVLDRSLLATVPKRPGVYLMRDVNDRILYIGKAKNLRDRLTSYYSQPLGYTRKMDGLVESLAAIEIEETGSELGALLLESQLIRRFQPRYNVMMRSFEQYPFIRVDVASTWPRVTLARTRRDDDAVYFGPFKSSKTARTAVELINDHFPLRTCPRSFKSARSLGSPCLRLDLGKCAGPCVGRADRDGYMAHVHDVIRFLEGEDDALLDRMWLELEQSAASLDYERARVIRNDIQRLQHVIGAHRALREAAERQTLLVVQPAVAPDTIEITLVVRGQRWASFLHSRAADPRELADRLEGSWRRCQATSHTDVDCHTLDEVHILNRWIARRAGHPALVPVPAIVTDWLPFAHAAVRPTDAELTAAPAISPGERDDDPDAGGTIGDVQGI